MTPYDVAMFAAIAIGGALAFYALGRHHGYERGWIEALDKLNTKLRRKGIP
jgi:hypothetical protein